MPITLLHDILADEARIAIKKGRISITATEAKWWDYLRVRRGRRI